LQLGDAQRGLLHLKDGLELLAVKFYEAPPSALIGAGVTTLYDAATLQLRLIRGAQGETLLRFRPRAAALRGRGRYFDPLGRGAPPGS
jgi:hypothetical protein